MLFRSSNSKSYNIIDLTITVSHFIIVVSLYILSVFDHAGEVSLTKIFVAEEKNNFVAVENSKWYNIIDMTITMSHFIAPLLL